MASWTYGLDDQGNPQLLGPFESEDDAQDAGADLNGVRIVNAATRQEAIVRLQSRVSPRSQRSAEPMRLSGDAQDDDFDNFRL